MRAARELEEILALLAKRQGALDLAWGEGLDRLFTGDRILRLGYSTERDYARERLGVPPRTMFQALALARACAGQPLLRKAVASGLVSPCKARALAPVVGDDEPAWTAFAMDSTVRALEAAVRATGREPPPEFGAESLVFRMSPLQQDRLDRALALAAEAMGGGVPTWQCYEALAQEWLSDHGEWEPEEGGAWGPAPREARPLPQPVPAQLAAIAEARPLVEERVPETGVPRKLDAFVLRLAAERSRHDEVVGVLALRVVDGCAWAAAGYRTVNEYSTERLGMSPGVFRQRVWLERRMFALPELRDALSSGRLTCSKALLVAQEATEENVADLIAQASATTWQQTERDATAREDRRNRAVSVRRLWAPRRA
ncbi:MAG: hypothetical protein ACHQ1G_12285 [Planctomycetota bacterium]